MSWASPRDTVTGLSSGVATITAGAGHTCAVTTTGAAKCWGQNRTGSSGTAPTKISTRPSPTIALHFAADDCAAILRFRAEVGRSEGLIQSSRSLEGHRQRRD